MLEDVFKVVGDSMKGAGLFDGMTVKVDKNRKATNGDKVVVMIDGKVFIKEYYFDGNREIFKSRNPEYPDISDYEFAEILGVMSWFGRV